MKSLKLYERRLAARLLRAAAATFSNHGENKFSLLKDGGLSRKEAVDLGRRFTRWDDDASDFRLGQEFIGLPAWLLMNFLADQLDPEDPDDEVA